jgi:predicted membrane metal-binding protein
MAKSSHEIVLPSDRSFGFTFTAVFSLVSAWAWWRDAAWWHWSLVAAVLFAAFAAVAPRLLHPLNILWMRLGALLNRIVSPVVLGSIYFLLLTPIAAAMRSRGRDVLHRRFDPKLRTYWIPRDPPGPKVENFPRQF